MKELFHFDIETTGEYKSFDDFKKTMNAEQTFSKANGNE